jgi:glucan biosynthesis protein C
LLRLFVPLVFGMLAIIPPQVYLERIFRHQFTGSYLKFWTSILTTGPYPQGNLSWHHLWFLAYLFVFSMLLLPIFLWMRSDKARARLSRAADFFSKNTRVFLMSVPLVLVQFLLRLRWPDGNQNLIDDWANFFFYSTVFIFGSLLLTDRKYLEAIERNRYGALAAAVLCALAIKIIGFPGGHIIAAMAFYGFNGFNTWCWLLALLGFGRKHLNFTNKVRDYAVEAALPFYILHQTFIIIIGFYVIQWHIALMLKFLLIIVLTFITVLPVYDLIVKRIWPVRFLFGMKSKKSFAG